MTTDPLARLSRLQQMLAAEQSIALKDEAGVINPQGVDAAHRAAAIRRIINTLNSERNEAHHVD
jgi:polyphosphate kinase 2 (PPK2 family)